jgi:hypothetical protein
MYFECARTISSSHALGACCLCTADTKRILRWNTGSVVVLIVAIVLLVVLSVGLHVHLWRGVQRVALCCCAVRLGVPSNSHAYDALPTRARDAPHET